jgi:hypothetical protein
MLYKSNVLMSIIQAWQTNKYSFITYNKNNYKEKKNFIIFLPFSYSMWNYILHLESNKN